MCFSNQSLREVFSDSIIPPTSLVWEIWLFKYKHVIFFFRLKAEFPKEINQTQPFENWTYYAKLMYPQRGKAQSTWN